MHRSFDIVVPSAASKALAEELRRCDDVIAVTVVPAAALKPAGDLLRVHALNRGADAVLAAVGRCRRDGDVSIASSQVSSIIDPAHQRAVAADVDDSVWEDMETDLRQHSQLSSNFVALMLLGGVVAACGLLATDASQAIAVIAAAVIAPGFEPLGKIPLGLVLRHWSLVRRGCARSRSATS